MHRAFKRKCHESQSIEFRGNWIRRPRVIESAIPKSAPWRGFSGKQSNPPTITRTPRGAKRTLFQVIAFAGCRPKRFPRRKNSAFTRSLHAVVLVGVILTTRADQYSQIRIADYIVLTVHPRTLIDVGALQYMTTLPQAENRLLVLLKAGLRSVTGLVGNRARADAYVFGSPVMTIGIR